MRQMMETLFARVEALQQNQAVQLAGVNDRLDAVELEIPLIQEQGALRIRDLETRMSVEIEEAARSAVEQAAAGIQEEVTGRFGSLLAQIENQHRELVQMRDSKKLTESKLNRAVLDIERLCGSFPPRAIEEVQRPLGDHAFVEPAVSPYRSRISEHIRKAAVDAVPDDSNPLVGDPGQARLQNRRSEPLVKAPEPAATPPAELAAAAPPPKPASVESAVPGFDDWKRQFMQDGEPLAPSLGVNAGGHARMVSCPRCDSKRTRPAARNRVDSLLFLAGLTPHRCRCCAHRFYKRGVSGAQAYDDSAESHTEETVESR